MLISKLLTSDRIALDVEAEDWRQAVAYAGKLLVCTHAVEPRYVVAMIRNVQTMGPYIVISPGIALAHSRPADGVCSTAISLIRLRNPVPFGHAQNDPVDLVFALAATDEGGHIEALMHLSSLLLSQEKLVTIRTAETVDEVLGQILEQESGHSNKYTPSSQ